MGKKYVKIKDTLKRIVAILLVFTIILGSPHMQRIFGENISALSRDIRIVSATDNDADSGEIFLEDDEENIEGDFKYKIKDDKIVITGLSDDFSGNSITIPDEIDGKAVEEIGERAFYIKNIDSLILGSNLKKIGDYAFTGNDISSIEFPDSLEEVGENAFKDNNLSVLILKSIKKVGEGAFINNNIANLDLGNALVEIGTGAFKNNNIKEVSIPETLTTVGDNIFADNKRFVKLIGDNISTDIPKIQKEEEAYGYVINPIILNIRFINRDTNEALLDSIRVGDDLSSLNNVFVKGEEQEYKAPELPGYKLYSENGENINSVKFTPNTDPYELNVEYIKKNESIELKLKDIVLPKINVGEQNIKEVLRDFIVASDSRGTDLSEKVEILPEDLDVSTEGAVRDVFYILRDEDSGETKYLSLKVYVGTDLTKFPLGNDWTLGDFRYGTAAEGHRVLGYSNQGNIKVQTNKELVLPHINPYSGEIITAIGQSAFSSSDLHTVKSFDDNITEIGNNAFYGRANLISVDLHKVETIGNSAFENNTKLQEFDFSKLENVGSRAFKNTGIKKVEAPELTQMGDSSFEDSYVGTDTDFLDAIYLPRLTRIGTAAFKGTSISYVDSERQFPMAREIGNSAFYNIRGKVLSDVNIPKIVNIEDRGFGNSGINTLIAPDLVKTGSATFAENKIKNLSLPKIKEMGDATFRSNGMETLDLPEAETVGATGFANNKLGEINLPKLKTIGRSAFESNDITSVIAPKLERIDTYAFMSSSGEPYAKDANGKPNRNPGLEVLSYFIPIYTENTNISSRENYIINPIDAGIGAYEEDDFTWDSEDDTKVIGFTPKGKSKYIAKDFRIELPSKARSIGDYAFNAERVKSIVAQNVTIVGRNAFDQNEFESIEMPNLEVVAYASFNRNMASEDKKIKKLSLPKLRKVDNNSFSSLGIESLDIPLLERTETSSFAANNIYEINAPKLKEVGVNSFAINKFGELSGENFPSLERVEANAFRNNPVTKLDLTKLKYSAGDNEYDFLKTGLKEPLIWILPEGIKNRYSGRNNGRTLYSSSTFSNHIVEGGPDVIILTENPNSDGTLKRLNPDGYREYPNNDQAYYRLKNGNRKQVSFRRVIINPSTLKVNYKMDDGKSLDGKDGRPKLEDYREYIYEEQSFNIETGVFNQAKTYIAPAIDGYTILSSTDASGNTVKGRINVDVPFEREGNRTDREITFIYTKIAKNFTDGPKVEYGIGKDNKIVTQSSIYTINRQRGTAIVPQMLTIFNINEVKKPIKNGRIKIEFDSPYLDMEKTEINTSTKIDEWYVKGSWVIRDMGIDINLNNTIDASSKLSSAINYKFKENTPDGTTVNIKMTLVGENENGVYEIIGEAKTVSLTCKNQVNGSAPMPSIQVNFSNTLTSPYRVNEADNGPRDLGKLVDRGEIKAVEENPPLREYYYRLFNIPYEIEKISLLTEIPEYTYIDENNIEHKKLLEFDKSLNPDWELSGDGKKLIYTKKLLIPTANPSIINAGLPRLKFKFPNAKEGAVIVNKTYASLTRAKDIRDPNIYSPIEASGDLGIGDSLTIYPLYIETNKPSFADVTVSKRAGSNPRSRGNYTYLYDILNDRKKDISYDLNLSATNELSDLKDVSIIDYELDPRLRYSELKFNNTAPEAQNMEVSIIGYKKIGEHINPSADRQVFEREIAIDRNNSVIFGNLDIDYIQIKLLGTDIKPFNNKLSFTILTKVKDINNKLLDNGNSDKLVNKALFLANQYKKNTNIPEETKPTDAKYEYIEENYIRDMSANVNIVNYKAHLGIEKRLSYGGTLYPSYPSLETGNVVLEGKEGSYHIFLNSHIEGSTERADEVIKNLEIIDIMPEAVEFEKRDIELDRSFVKNGGKLEVIPEYEVLEDGKMLKRTALKFSAKSFDIGTYENNSLRIASIKTKYTGVTTKDILTNKIYAKWDNENVVIENIAKNVAAQEIGPNGRTLALGEKAYAYADASIKVFRSSALIGQLYIKNHTDNIWQKRVPTRSDEKFDYKILISNYDNEEANNDYAGLDIVNVLPEIGDTNLNKSGSRGTELDGVKIDTSRQVKVPNGYKIQYYNTTKKLSEILAGNNSVETVVNDTSITWSDTPNEDTKMVRIKAENGIRLLQGESLSIEIPMVAPSLGSITDSKIGKKAVDSFVFRYYKRDTNEYVDFAEPNSVENYMEAPEGSVSFVKYGKEGRLLANSTAVPLAGANFELVDSNNQSVVLDVATSNAEGKVKFEHILTNKDYIIYESGSPEGYFKSSGRLLIHSSDFEAAKADDYAVDKSTVSKNLFMNVKDIKGGISIKKTAIDKSVPLVNVAFRIRGLSQTNSTYDRTFATSEDGQILVNGLSEGTYSIEEIESGAINRYQKVNVPNVTIDANNLSRSIEVVNDKFQVLFRKIAVEDDSLLNPDTWDTLTDYQKKPLSGYKFKVDGEDGSHFTTNYTGADGNTILKDLKTNVVYTVTEFPLSEQRNSNKDLYAYNNNVYKFKITHDGQLVNVANGNRFKQYALNIPNKVKKIKGKAVITKIDKEDATRVLAGAKLAIYKIELDSDGVTTLNKVGEDKITDNEGKVVFDGLEPANYQVKELEPPIGYILNNIPLDINIPENLPERVGPEYNKSGNDVIYTINKNLENIASKVSGIKGSDIAGQKNMPLSAAKIYIESKKKDNPNLKYRTIGNSFVNVYEPVAGAKFELYKLENGRKNGNAIEINGSSTITSGVDGSINFGDYKFEFDAEYGIFETEPAEGYEKSEGYKTFRLSEEAKKAGFNGTYSFYMNNETSKGEIAISKYDSVAKRNLAGARFNIYKGTKESADFSKPYKSIVTNDDGIAYFPRLSFNDYVVREESAPVGYKQPVAGRDDINVPTLTLDNPSRKYKVFNAKLIDVSIRKEWVKGSEAGIKVKLLRTINKRNLDAGEVVKVDGLTDENGIVTLSKENNWSVKYPKLEMADNRGNIYYFKPIEVEVRAGQGVDEEYTNEIYPADSTKLVVGEGGYSFIITNTAKNTASVKVKKLWKIGDSNEALVGSKVDIVLKKIRVGTTDLSRDNSVGEPITLDATDSNEHIPWYHSFDELPLREWGENVEYTVEEVSTPLGFKPATYERTQVGNNTNITITNESITRNINVEKRWIGIDDMSKLPNISIQVYDSEDMTRVIDSKRVELEEGKYVAKFSDIPSYTYTVNTDGSISARAIKYVFKEKYYSAGNTASYENPRGYETTISTNMDYASYSQAENAAKSLDVVLSNTLATTNINISKTWSGINKTKAPEVRVKLVDITADESLDGSDTSRHIDVRTDIALNVVNDFKTTIENIPKYKPDGITKIKYEVVELSSKVGYELTKAKTEEENAINFNLTNTRLSESVKLSKTWEMAVGFYEGENVDKPEVHLHLFAVTNDDLDTKEPAKYISDTLEEEVGTIVLNEDNNYTKTLSDLPKYREDGVTPINYYVTEDEIIGFKGITEPKKLELNEENVLATNINNVQEKLSLNVEKHWAGLDKYESMENIPAIHVNLYDITDSANKKLVQGDVALVKDNADPGMWSASFVDMPKYYLDGRQIKYAIEEKEKLAGYELTTAEPEAVDSGLRYTLTNTAKEVSVKVNKLWENKKEAGVEVELLRDGTVLSRATISANEEGNYTYTFESLPMYAIDGRTKYIYTVREKAIKGYDNKEPVKIENINPDDGNLIFNITNVYKTVDIKVRKSWVGVSENEALEIGLQLVDETNPDSPINLGDKYIVVLNKNKWEGSLENLPKYKEDGQTLIKYNFVETPVLAGYKYSSRAELSEVPTNEAPYGTWAIEVGNERIKEDIEVEKLWAEDTSGYIRPEVRVNLLKDESDNGIDDPELVDTYTLNAAVQWKLRDSLPKYATDGSTLIKYYVKELEVNAYNTPSENIPLVEGTSSNGKTVLKANITNSLKTVNVAVEKTWEGLDKYTDTTKLPSIHIRLKDVTNSANKLNVGEAKALIKEGDTWKTSFENLPMYKEDGTTLIKYDIEEVEDENLLGYTLVKGDSPQLLNGTYTFKLTNKVESVKIKLKKSWLEIKNGTSSTMTEDTPAIKLKLVDKTPTGTSIIANALGNIVRNILNIFAEGDSTNSGASISNTNSDINLTNKEFTLSSDNNYEEIILDLPKYHIDGITPVIYGIEEDTKLAGYEFSTEAPESEDNGNTIVLKATNTRVNVPIKLKKTWEDDNSGYTRPEVRFNIYTGTDESATPIKEVKLSGDTNFESTLDLPKYAANGVDEISYYAEEVVPKAYKSDSTRVLLTNENGILSANIKNSLILRDVEVIKEWKGVEAYKDLSKLPKIHVELFDITNGEASAKKVGETKELIKDTDGLYKTTYEKLPMYTADGSNEIKYMIKEVEEPSLSGYRSELKTPISGENDKLSLGIENIAIKQEIKVKKTWKGVSPDNAPEIRLKLVAKNGANLDIANKEVSLNKDNGFKGSFGQLPKYDIDGKIPIEYSLIELDEKKGYSFTQAKAEGIEVELEAINERVTTVASLTKTWIEDGTNYERPDVHFKLYVGDDDSASARELTTLTTGEPIGDIVLTKASNWRAIVNNLPKYDESGEKPLKYYVEEVPVAGYKNSGRVELSTSDISENILSGNIDNELVPTNVIVEQTFFGIDIYKDEARSDLPRIDIDLYDITDATHPIKLNKVRTLELENTSTSSAINGLTETSPKWITRYENLPKYKTDGLTEIKYGIGDISSFEGYIQSEPVIGATANGDILISFIESVKETKLNVRKTWMGVDEVKAPAIELRLLEKGEEVIRDNDVKEVGKNLVLSKETNWQHEYKVPKYHIDGMRAIIYDFEEINQKAGYTFKVESYESLEDSTNIILSNTRKTIESIKLEKTWDNEEDNYRRPNVILGLYTKSGEEYLPINVVREGNIYKVGEENSATNKISIDATSNWTIELKDMPKYDIAGKELLHYYVKEEPMQGYIVPDTYIELETITEDNLYAKIENKIEKRSIKAIKKWIGIENYSEEELKNLAKVHAVLYDVTGIKKKVEILELAKNTGGEYEAIFDNVPKYKADGITPIIYEVEELEADKLEGFNTSIEKKDEDTYEITNSLKTGDISVTKTWRVPPFLVDKVEVYLTKNGEKIGDTVSLRADTGWTYNFKNVPEYEPDGITKIKYSVKEVEVFAYQTHLKVLDDSKFEIYNIYTGIVHGGDKDNRSVVNRFTSGKVEPKPSETIYEEEKATSSTPEKVKEKILSLIPKTGDNSNSMIYLSLVLVSSLTLIIIVLLKKKEKN